MISITTGLQQGSILGGPFANKRLRHNLPLLLNHLPDIVKETVQKDLLRMLNFIFLQN